MSLCIFMKHKLFFSLILCTLYSRVYCILEIRLQYSSRFWIGLGQLKQISVNDPMKHKNGNKLHN